MPEISLVVPVHNAGSHLVTCLDSLLLQSFGDFEAICVDDASSDNSRKILEKYSRKDSRFKIIPLPDNRGAAVARNIGLDFASGRLVGFIDADDFVNRTFLENLYKIQAETDADIVKGMGGGEIRNSYKFKKFLNLEVEKDRHAFLMHWQCALYSADVLKKNRITFPANARSSQDTAFLIKAVSSADSIVTCDNAYYYHRRQKNSLTSTVKDYQKFKYQLWTFRDILAFANDNLDTEQYPGFLFMLAYHLVRNSLKTLMDRCDADTQIAAARDLAELLAELPEGQRQMLESLAPRFASLNEYSSLEDWNKIFTAYCILFAHKNGLNMPTLFDPSIC